MLYFNIAWQINQSFGKLQKTTATTNAENNESLVALGGMIRTDGQLLEVKQQRMQKTANSDLAH